MATFQNFYLANLRLNPAEGDEESVIPVDVYRGSRGLAYFLALSDEEVELLIKTRGIWVTQACADAPPPLWAGVEAPIWKTLDHLEVYGHLSEIFNATRGHETVGVIYYLDLAFMYLKPGPEERFHRWKTVKDPDVLARHGKAEGEIQTLEYYDADKDEWNGRKYLFSRDLMLAGAKLGELPNMAPMLDIHPFLSAEMLIFVEKPAPKKPLIILPGRN